MAESITCLVGKHDGFSLASKAPYTHTHAKPRSVSALLLLQHEEENKK